LKKLKIYLINRFELNLVFARKSMVLLRKKFMRTVLFSFLVLILTLPVSLYAEPVTENTLLDEAMQLYTAGEYAVALPQLLYLLDAADDASPMIEARLAAARIYQQAGQLNEALEQVNKISPALRNDQTRLLEGQILFESGFFSESLATFKRIDEQKLSPAQQATLFIAMARATVKEGDVFPALWFIHRALKSSDLSTQQTEAFSLLMELLQTEEVDPQLSEITFMFAGTPVGTAASIRQIENNVASGDDDLARVRIELIDIGLLPPDFRKSAIDLYTELTGESWLQRSVGVILPLSGKYAVYGDLVRKGMELALEGAANPTDVRFLFYDGAADADRGRAAVRSLARGEKVVAITGSIAGSSAMEIAEQAQAEQVPLLTLAQSPGLPETGPYVFRTSLNVQQQVETLVRYAVIDQGITSFGMLYPENRLGRHVADLFVAAVENLGGEVIDAQSYADTANDFGRQIKKLKGESLYQVEKVLTDDELLLDLFIPEPPPVEFEALFIPDVAERISVIVPQLAYYGIEDVPLLGINGWNSPELLRTVGNYVEGAVFVDDFFAYSPYPFVKEFVDRYYAKYAEAPTFLQAQGYDAAGILLSLLENQNIRSRVDLRLAMSQMQTYPGVTGATTFNFIGEAQKLLYLLQVRNGNIEQLNNVVDTGTTEPTIDNLINDQLIHE
jgi:ABC-type branched-subunit amino acid transport system substrate-binding protein